MKRKESGLVFLDAGRKEPYTTDEVIAECSGVKRPTVTRLIRNRQNDLEEFGRLGFEIRTLQTKGGAQEVKIYHLNEQQATLLITYLRNTEAVTAFKKALVREFYAMRKELQKRRELRIEGKPVRRSLTDMIRDNPDHNQWDYKLYSLFKPLDEFEEEEANWLIPGWIAWKKAGVENRRGLSGDGSLSWHGLVFLVL